MHNINTLFPHHLIFIKKKTFVKYLLCCCYRIQGYIEHHLSSLRVCDIFEMTKENFLKTATNATRQCITNSPNYKTKCSIFKERRYLWERIRLHQQKRVEKSNHYVVVCLQDGHSPFMPTYIHWSFIKRWSPFSLPLNLLALWLAFTNGICQKGWSRHNSLYCTSQILLFFFYKKKVCGNPKLSKSISTILPTAFAPFLSLCHILVIPKAFQTFHYYDICYGDVINDHDSLKAQMIAFFSNIAFLNSHDAIVHLIDYNMV